MQKKILRQDCLCPDVYRLVLEETAGQGAQPGQFAMLQVPAFYLKRPISFCDAGERESVFVYRVQGRGTARLSAMQPGEFVEILSPLGNGFDLTKGQHPLLLGGGMGAAPMLYLAKRLLQQGKTPTIALGFRDEKTAFLLKEFEALGAKLLFFSEDGSLGEKGFATQALETVEYDFYYACGPAPMLQATEKQAQTPGQISMEERMGCGFGACMGCSIKTMHGPKRVCKDGPVFDGGEIQWQ